MSIRISTLMFVAALFATVTFTQTRSNDETTIRDLEQKQVAFLLKGEIDQMEDAWLPEFTVNNPFGDIVNGHRGPIRKGELTYSGFTRNIEKIVFRNEIAIVMGSESVVPKGISENAGTKINRRFTNFWVKADGKWRMLARHANVVCAPKER